MIERWYRDAIIYSIEVDLFADSNGDGCGDIAGLISRLDYLSRLGVTCLWLNPIYPSPFLDGGYDVADYYGIDPRFGTLGDFAELIHQTRERGMRVLMDLVVNHTSDRHPWFRSARGSRDSPYRDWYVWSDDEPSDRFSGMVLPGEQRETWSYDDVAGAWYHHRFHGFQPDLNWSNPAVRQQVRRIIGFWLQMGVAGFRVDAVPYVLEQSTAARAPGPRDFTILEDWRQLVQWRSGDAVLLCEADVDPPELPSYTGSRADSSNDRAHMMFGFVINAKLWLALARRQAEPLVEALSTLPQLHRHAQWATFLRNHDESSLGQLTDDQRQDVYHAFAPRTDMRVFGRGVRRRTAPMLRGDRRRMELAYALQFSLPGTPVLRYGDEIGMGEDLSRPGRQAIRTPMQWDDTEGAGFSSCPPQEMDQPIKVDGKYGNRRVNVRRQQRESTSLLRWFEQLISVVKETPEIGVGDLTVLDDSSPGSVLVHRIDAPAGSVVLLHNLADRATTVDIGPLEDVDDEPWEIFSDAEYEPPTRSLRGLRLHGWGYRWIRLRRTAGG